MTNKTDIRSDSSGNLLHNLLLFGRLLRELGLEVTPDRMISLVEALDYIEIGHRQDFYHAVRCNLIYHESDITIFDKAFDLFWRRIGDYQLPLLMDQPQNRVSSVDETIIPPDTDQLIIGSPALDPDEELESSLLNEGAKTFSDREILREKDFSDMSEDEIESVHRLMARLFWQLGSRKARRFRPGSGQLLDLRRSLRQNLNHGGEILEWSRRLPRSKLRPLVAIADISGSMDRYSRLLLQFIYTLAEGLEQQVEGFVFSTRLTRITRQLRVFDVNRAMADVTEAVPDWSSGTRIGQALKQFNFDWARRVLGRGAVVLLISDGWDRGDIDLLASEMARLQRSCFRLIWLNPLLGLPDYEPLTRGMKAALPYVDDFLPVHNLNSLEALANHLFDLDDRRPSRKQQKIAKSHAAAFKIQ